MKPNNAPKATTMTIGPDFSPITELTTPNDRARQIEAEAVLLNYSSYTSNSLRHEL